MTEMEKNSDVIVMHCYAPMLVNVNPGGRQWRPDLIGYNALRAFGSPSYYAIQMFGANVGDEIVKVSATPANVFASATRHQATGVVYLKLVNANAQPQVLHLDFGGATIRDASALTLAAASTEATNSIGTPDAVTPQLTPSVDVRSGSGYTLPANAVVVLTLRTK